MAQPAHLPKRRLHRRGGGLRELGLGLPVRPHLNKDLAGGHVVAMHGPCADACSNGKGLGRRLLSAHSRST